MKKRAKTLVALIVLCLILPLSIAVYADNGGTIVYLGTYSDCYHRANCTYLDNPSPTTLSAAVALGKRPCSRCMPPRLDTSKSNDNSPYVIPNSYPNYYGSSAGGGGNSGGVAVIVVIVLAIFGVRAFSRKSGNKPQPQTTPAPRTTPTTRQTPPQITTPPPKTIPTPIQPTPQPIPSLKPSQPNPPLRPTAPKPSPTPTKPSNNAPRCPKCGAKMYLKTGRFGKFYGCSRFPECKGSRNYTEPS